MKDSYLFQPLIPGPIPLLSEQQDLAMPAFVLKLSNGLNYASEFSGHTNKIRCLAKHKDFLATGSTDLTINLWSIHSHALIFTLKGHDDWVVSLCFSKDGKSLYSTSGNGTVKTWSTSTGTELHSFKAHEVSINTSSITSTHLLTGSFDKTIRIWDLSTYALDFTFTGHTEPVYTICVTKDEQTLFSGSRDRSIKVWDIPSRSLITTLTGHQHWIYTVALSPDQSFLASGSEDKTVRIWDIVESREKLCLYGHIHVITCVNVTNDNKFVISGSDSIFKIWEIAEGIEIAEVKCHKGYLRCLTTTEDRRFVITAGDDNVCRFWDIGEKKSLIELVGHSNTVTSLDCTEKYAASASEDKNVVLWALDRKEKECVFVGHKDRVFCVSFGVTGETLYSSSADRTLRVWDIASMKEKAVVSGFGGWVRCISSNEKFIYVGCDDKQVYIVSASSLEIVGTLKGHTNSLFSNAVDCERGLLASGAMDKVIIVWETVGNTEAYRLEGHEDTVTALKFGNGKLYSGSADCTVKVWSLELRVEQCSLSGHSGSISSICWDSYQRLLLSASEDKTVRAWNIDEKRQEYSINAHSLSVSSVCANSSYVISGSVDKIVKVWDLHKPSSTEIEPLPSQSYYDFTVAVCAFSKSPRKMTATQASLPLSKYLFTLPHIFCHTGQEDLLEIVLESKPEIKTDAFGNSPLFYSITKRSQPCTDLILKYLIAISEDQAMYLTASYALRNDVIRLIQNSSSLLPDIFNTLLVSQCKVFGQPATNLAIVKESIVQKVFPVGFLKVTSASSEPQQELQLEFETSSFQLPMTLGSNSSLELIETLLDCSNKKIFQSELVQHFIRYKWNEIWNVAFFYTILMWSNLLLILMMIVFKSNHLIVSGLFAAINILLVLVEIVQLFNSSFSAYFSELWNWIDLTRFILSAVWLALENMGYNVHVLTWVTIFVNFTKGVTGFRAFNRTRFYVRLFFRSFQDIFFFLIIFFYSTFGFGLLFTSTKNLEVESLIRYIWLFPFDLNLGNFDSNESIGLDYLGFFLASIVNVIVLLSLLISILGDSFDRFQLEAIEIDHIEMADLVYDLELLYFWNRNSGRLSYLQVCDTLKSSYSLTSWEGNSKAIENNVAKAFDKRLKLMENDLDATNKSLFVKIHDLDTKFAKNLASLDQKLDKFGAVANELSKNFEKIIEAIKHK